MSITRLQGSIVVKEDVTIRLYRHISSNYVDFALTAGWEFDSVDAFLALWQAFIRAWAPSHEWTVGVNTTGASKGKITITNTGGGTYSIAWAHAGSATEGARIRTFLGESGDSSGNTSPYTFAATHKAGFYPRRGAPRVYQPSRSYRRGRGPPVGGGTWAQWDVEPFTEGVASTLQGGGIVSTDIELSLDGATDWAELGELVQFVDDVFAYMGAPWTLLHPPLHNTVEATAFTGNFAADDVLELVGSRVVDSWNGLLSVEIRQDARL